MKSKFARGLIPACAITAACVAAAALPTAASALGACEGGNIRGKGSSAQKILQKEIWNKVFNTDAEGCSGGLQPKVSYESTGSGAGLESWGIEQKTPGAQELWFSEKNAFVGTEIAPNKKQEEEILSHGPAGAKVLTIPVAQPALSIVMHLPAECSLEKGGDPGRIQLTQKDLEEIFEGGKKADEWGKILNKAKFTKASSKACKKDKITRVVREDGSGTTGAFMKFLGELNKGKPVYEGGGTWAQEG